MRLFTSFDKKKQPPANFLSLTGHDREAIVDPDIEKLSCDQGVANLIEKLDNI